MRVNDAYQLVDFRLVLGENLDGSLILGVKNNPPLQMIRCMSLERKEHEHGVTVCLCSFFHKKLLQSHPTVGVAIFRSNVSERLTSSREKLTAYIDNLTSKMVLGLAL